MLGRAAPLDRTDVDTDQIVPARYIRRIERTGYEDALFAEWRTAPGFVLNDPRYRSAKILIARHNFGCGSSREHAVWALRDWGFEAVIAPSFADIFRDNCLRNGFLPAIVDERIVEILLRSVAADPSVEMLLDVALRQLRVPGLGIAERFELDEDARVRLLGGIDEIDLTLRYEAAIVDHERRITPPGNERSERVPTHTRRPTA